jgi:alkanesulfonate monooxygenase SsuD/methylene tetrahydromethanopterin reductase-like flavin-dependent oxidoreductase (luciferase family)
MTVTQGMVHPWVVERQGCIRFGIFGGMSGDWGAARDRVQLAEGLGYDAVWVGDHPLISQTDCWTRLVALANATRTMRLGTLVCCAFYRHPAVLARQAADIDRLSNGRMILGVGSGSYLPEFDQLGIPRPSNRDRAEAVRDTIEIVRGLWGGEPFTYAGPRYQVTDARLDSGPIQQPHVPLVVAGGGEKVTLRYVAQHADATNMGPGQSTGGATTPEDVERKLAALRGHCETLGRPYDAILRCDFHNPVFCAETSREVTEKVNSVPEHLRNWFGPGLLAGTPRELIDYYRGRVAAGMQYFVVSPRDDETLRLLAEKVMPELQPG